MMARTSSFLKRASCKILLFLVIILPSVFEEPFGRNLKAHFYEGHSITIKEEVIKDVYSTKSFS
jgi:hypothetical protein